MSVVESKGSIFTQIYATATVNCLMFSYGASLGWISPALNILQSEDTPVPSGPLTMDEIAIIASIGCVGGIITSIISGYIADKIGRKLTFIVFGTFYVSGWFLVIFAQNSYYLILSRIFHGLGGGVAYNVVPIFITEISEDRVRGRLGALLLLSCNLGILYAFVVGAVFDYFTVSICHLLIPVAFFVGITFVKESPLFLIQNARFKEAEKSLKFYRGYKNEDSSDKIKYEYDKMLSLMKTASLNNNKDDGKITIQDFLTKAAIKSIIFGFALMTFEIFTGSYALICYASLVFEEGGSTLSPNVSAIIIAIIQVVGVQISVVLVDRTGRRFLLIISAIFCTLGQAMFSIYDYLKVVHDMDVSQYNWIPLLSFAIVITFANFGLISLPFLVLSELTPVKIKSISFSVFLTYSWILALLTIVFLPASIDYLGMYGTLLIFAINCFIATIFIAIYLPETKNRSIEEIQEIMSK